MKDWILGMIVKWLLAMISNGTIETIVAGIKGYVVPLVRKHKDELFARLKKEAAETETKVDDAWYAWLDALIDAFLPDCPKTLADVPARPDTVTA